MIFFQSIQYYHNLNNTYLSTTINNVLNEINTTIIYSLLELTNVSLKIYNVLWRKVTTLVNEKKPTGNYKVEFSAGSSGNASSLPNGIYFYRLEAGRFFETKKLILIKENSYEKNTMRYSYMFNYIQLLISTIAKNC
jgi:hypothetical protein